MVMKRKELERHYSYWLYVGIGCMVMLLVASFLSGIADYTNYTSVGNTWGIEYYKELSFMGHKTGIRSFIMLFFLGIVIGGISELVRSDDRNEHLLILLGTALVGIVLLVRTIDYTNHPSKLVLGSNHSYQSFKKSQYNNKDYSLIQKKDAIIDSILLSKPHPGTVDFKQRKSCENTSIMGIKARKVTEYRTYTLGEGFWIMLFTIIIQLVASFSLWRLNKKFNKII